MPREPLTAAELHVLGLIAERLDAADASLVRDAVSEIERLRSFTAKDVLLYLFSDCVKWTEDVDGDARDDGSPYTIVHHDIRISDAHLSELMDMAGIHGGLSMESTLERLARANKDDLATQST